MPLHRSLAYTEIIGNNVNLWPLASNDVKYFAFNSDNEVIGFIEGT